MGKIVIVHNMKSLFIKISALIITAISLLRVLDTADFKLKIFGSFITIIFGVFSFYLIFENQIKSSKFFTRYSEFISKNMSILNYAFIFICVILLETLILSYSTEVKFFILLKVFLTFLFATGGVIILIRIYHLLKKE